ncbi:MAG: FAD-dependent oxidoreductase [Alphaproteobacteria bacterium]|nr:FAD-dependent oxidoreductase [Alphaproteobacteria bacterium]
MYDVIILGSGPAGLTAALYASRAGKKTLVLGGDQLGGQLNVIHALENYPGFIGTGPELAAFMKKQCESFGAEIVMASAKTVNSQQSTVNSYKIVADDGIEYESKTVIIATGAKPRKMDAAGAREFIGRGVSYCATCDGFFYSDKDVIVVGGGNSALSDALYMANIAKSVKIIYRKGSFARAEDVVVKRVEETENISVLWNTEIAEIGGSDMGVEFVITNTGEKIMADGVFIAIGHEANTDYLDESIKRDDAGRLVASTLPTGMYVAGDVRAGIKLQVATAVGWGCEVAMDCIEHLNSNK